MINDEAKWIDETESWTFRESFSFSVFLHLRFSQKLGMCLVEKLRNDIVFVLKEMNVFIRILV